MAVARSAGPPRPNRPAAGTAPPFQIGKIEIVDVMACIAKGVQDFGRAPRYGMFFGAIYALGGLMIVWVAFAMRYPYLAYPFIMGFAFFAPFGAAGTYEISRRLESGEALSWPAVTGAVWSRSGNDLAWLGLVSLLTLFFWLDLAVFLFWLFYGPNIPSLPRFLANIFTSAHGMAFLLIGNGLGAILALLVFSISAISPPLVVDRHVHFVTAIAASVRAVIANPPAMLVWAVLIGAGLVVSFATLFIALLVIFPILGHATWHLYRRVIL